MKNLLTLLAIIFSLLSSAQITFTKNDYGTDRDKILYAVDTPINLAINFGATGANYRWNFTGKHYPRRYDSTTFYSVTFDSNATSVVANLLLKSVANGNQYQEVKDSFVKIIYDLPAYHITGVKLKLFNFPLAYQSTSSDSVSVTTKGLLSEFGIQPISGVDSVRIDAKINTSTICDGWGQLTIPDNTTYSSLRIKNTNIINANIYIHTLLGWSFVSNQIQNKSSYQWYAPNSKSYIASVTLDTLGNYSNFIYKVSYVPPKITSPTITSVSPDSAMQGQQLMITIKCKNSYLIQGLNQVYVYKCNVDSFKVIDDTTVNAFIKVPLSALKGWGYVELYISGIGYIYINNGFKILASPYAPSLKSVSPGYGYAGQKLDLLITASQTHFTKGVNNIFITANTSSIGNVNVNSFSVVNDSVMICKIIMDSTIAGRTSFNIRAYNSIDGNLYLDSSYTVVNTGINELNNSSTAIAVYPNPTNGMLTIKLPMEIKYSQVTIADVSGKLVFNENINADENNNLILRLHHLENGIYFISVNTGDRIFRTKLVLNK